MKVIFSIAESATDIRVITTTKQLYVYSLLTGRWESLKLNFTIQNLTIYSAIFFTAENLVHMFMFCDYFLVEFVKL